MLIMQQKIYHLLRAWGSSLRYLYERWDRGRAIGDQDNDLRSGTLLYHLVLDTAFNPYWYMYRRLLRWYSI
jgi:hypothetical protein